MKTSLVRPVMSKAWIVEDELWELIEPLLPPWPAKSPGPRPVSDRLCLQGVLFVLHTGIGWEDLPKELGFDWGHDLLAAVEALERRGRVRRAATDPARPIEHRDPDRLVEGGGGSAADKARTV
jgi:transposase